MESTRYTYGKLFGWIVTTFFVAFILFSPFIWINRPDSNPKIWVFVVILMLIGEVFCLAYFSKRFLIPAIKEKVGLGLDEEKLQSHFDGITLYWKDIFDMSMIPDGKLFSAISIGMIDGSGPYKITTRYIADSNKSIYNKMQEYLEKSR